MEDQLKALMEHIAEDDRRFIMTIHLYTYHIDDMGFGRTLWDSTKEESYYEKDDALSRLFDLDLFGWQLKGIDWGFDYCYIPTYSVSMWKMA